MKDNINWKKIRAKAAGMALEAHDGQTRRDGLGGEKPYIKHVDDVVMNIDRFSRNYGWDAKTTDRRAAISYLHDVVEDTEFTFEDMRNADIPEVVISVVEALTRKDWEDYDTFVKRVKCHSEDAIWVKTADNLANLADAPTVNQLAKYGRSLALLHG